MNQCDKYERIKRLIKIFVTVAVFIGIVIFFYIGINGTPWGKTQHEERVHELLNTYHRDTFTIVDTTYDYMICPGGYITTYYYNAAPDVPFKLQYLEGGEWEIFFLTRMGREESSTFSGEPMIGTNRFVIRDVHNFIEYAQSLSHDEE